MNTENDTDAHADALFDAAMAQEAERPDLAPSAEEEVSPAEMLEATVESARAERAAGGGAEPEKLAAAEPVKFTAEEFLSTRERAQAAERRLADAEKQGKDAEKQAEQKAGLFEDPEKWETERKAEIKTAVDEARAEFRSQMIDLELEMSRARMGDEKFALVDAAVTDMVSKDPAFAKAVREMPARGAGKALEAWYDKNEPLLNPAAYEARLREKWEAERSAADAPNGRPAGQKPATGASAAGENVFVLPKSLSRQASSRAATDDGDGDDSEAAIFAAGANTRRA